MYAALCGLKLLVYLPIIPSELEVVPQRHESNSAFLRVILGISLGFKGLEETSLGLEETSLDLGSSGLGTPSLSVSKV